MKVVVVHRGARDRYQVAVGLQARGLLHRLVTDVYLPLDRSIASGAARFLPMRLKTTLRQRWNEDLPSGKVVSLPLAGIRSYLGTKMPHAAAGLTARWMRDCDHSIGRKAGRLARESGSILLSYSYYAEAAFESYGDVGTRILFQLHPHPRTVRRLLRQELESHPDWAESLRREWEVNLKQSEFDGLAEEPHQADEIIVASSFTARTLVENGISPANIHVVPYGIQPTNSRGAAIRDPLGRRPLRVLFVGTVTQRKGVKYLLDAIWGLPPSVAVLMLCGEITQELPGKMSSPQVIVRGRVSAAELRGAYEWADVLVLPSVAEGFGHVLLEAMAQGLPIIATENTAAPDLIVNGIEGFLVNIHVRGELQERIAELASRPKLVAEMGLAAKIRAASFTPERFREGIARVVLEASPQQP